MLAVTGGHRYHEDRAALSGLDLRLGEGVTGLLGVNGAGKSTLLRAMAGSLRPSEGQVVFDGVSLYGPRRREVLPRVGYMPQEFAVPATATVRDSVRYLGWMRGLSRRDATAATDEVLEVVGLSDRAASRFGSLSGGMKRRVAFAQSIVARPEVLLLDEPTTDLDPEQRAAVREVLSRHDRDGTATVVSSHLIEDISTLADRLVVLEGGRVLVDESMAVFTARPGGTDEERFLRVLADGRTR